MEIHYVPLYTLKTYAGRLRCHESNVKAWMEVYRTLGMVRPLVVNATNGYLLNPPGELEALNKLQASEGSPPQGVLPDWRVPIWIVRLTDADESRWALVLAGGVDYSVFTRPYDESVVDVLLDEAEDDPNHLKVFGIDRKEYAALLEILATSEQEIPLNSGISGNPVGEYWGVPILDPGLQVDSLYPAVKWGTAARSKDLTGSLVHFYTDDSKFSALVNDATPVITSHAAAAIEVNFSTSPGMSRALVLYRTFQKRSISRRWQQVGIRILVDLNVDYEFGEINLYGVPHGWQAYAVRAYAKDLEHVEKAFEWATAHRGSEDVLFVVYGGGKRASELCRQRGWEWLIEDNDHVRGRYGARSPQT